MIELELHAVPEDGGAYACVARVVVADDGTAQVFDPKGYVPLEVPALISRRGEDGAPRRGFDQVVFADDPARWARNARTILRTGYLVPVIVRDDEHPDTVTQAPGRGIAEG